MARECYSASMKQKEVDSVYVDKLDMRDEINTRPEPSEELEPIQVDLRRAGAYHAIQASRRP